MKKILLTFLVLTLMIVPCLMLSACGDNSSPAPAPSSTSEYRLQSISVDGKIISIPSDITYTTYIVNTAPNGEMPEITLAKPTVMLKMPTVQEPDQYLDLPEPGVGATVDEVEAYNAEQVWKAFRENQEAWELYNSEVQAQKNWIAEKAGYDTYVRLVNICIGVGFSPEVAELIMSRYAHLFTMLNAMTITTENSTATVAIPNLLAYANIDYRIVDGNVLLNIFEDAGVFGLLGSVGEMGSLPVTIKYINGKVIIKTVEGFCPLTAEIIFA